MTSYRTKGLLAIGSSALALAACSRPDLATDLRPDGPPDVLTVSVLTDQFSSPPALGGVPVETATYCKPASSGSTTPDPLDPTVVGLPDFTITQYCPDASSLGDPKASPPLAAGQDIQGGPATLPLDEVTNADPLKWVARVEFDELIDPSVETLVNSDGTGPCGATDDNCVGHITTSLPFTLQCQDATGTNMDVPYDGYYIPNGNNVSWPVGPNLTVYPIDATTIPTGSECTLSLKSDVVKDKTGNAVPTDELGPWKFKTSAFAIVDSDPPACADVTDPTCPEGVTAGSCDGGDNSGAACAADADCPNSVCDPFTPAIIFNANIDVATVNDSATPDITVTDSANNPVAFSVAAAGTALVIVPTAIWAADTYTVTVKDGATFSDLAGGSMTESGDINMLFTVQ